MELWIFPFVALIAALIIIAVTYITSKTRHSERLMLLEKGLPPDYFKKEDQESTIKWAALFLGASTGFLVAFLVDLLVFDQRDGTEALYPSITTICASLALFAFRVFRTKTKR